MSITRRQTALYAGLALVFCGCAASAQDRPGQGNLTDHTYASGVPLTAEQRAVVFQSADLGIRVFPERQRIEGDATLVFKAKSPLERLVLDLDRNLPISAIDLDGVALAANRWRNPDGRLTIDLPAPLAAGETVTLRVRYGGAPHVAERAPWDGGFVWSTAPTGEPWIATAVQGQGCDLFWPCIDHPMAEPQVVTQHVTVPAPLVAAGNGVLLGVDEHDGWRTWHWRTGNPNTYAIALNIGPYELRQDEYRSRYGNTIPLRFWHLRDRGGQARELFAEFPRMLDFFEATIGPYPFAGEKMGVVETPHLGMEHQTINAYGNGYRKGEFGYDWLLQHEFAHEWFGNQLTNHDWDDMWLHEGFGSYMQPLYAQYLLGDMAYHAQLHDQRLGLVNRHPIVSGRPMLEHEVYDKQAGPGGDIYAKGSLVLHTLRGLIGDEAFFKATRRLVYGTDSPQPGRFAPRYADTPDFIDIVNDVTGDDLGWFFDVYLYSAALPELVVERAAGRLDLRWKTEGDRPFPMPLQVRVGPPGGEVVEVAMTGGRGHVALPDGQVFTVDPASKVLRAMPHVERYRADREARAKEPE
ncbi:peptidase M1 [Lysobacter arseniciresistens ZS79]|uniref:Aminopeptidase N n=1 Tax=Lysobacter arseniciresistens ZS79 TaxID=913325 RepID=A0A0A0F5J2_9GAMM|nr:M1 family metallopeptidase [Lysobacter arseniciresistens]KGM57765.1 peptidase M1 [Lysobacter arseniciresistens ZS79]